MIFAGINFYQSIEDINKHTNDINILIDDERVKIKLSLKN
jgi:hypothetical protein